MPRCRLYPEPEDSHQSREWKIFLQFLWKNEKVSFLSFGIKTMLFCKFTHVTCYDWQESTHAVVLYQTRISHPTCYEQEIATSGFPYRPIRAVPLDYSLQAYLEVIFLNPRMKIYVQGSLVIVCITWFLLFYAYLFMSYRPFMFYSARLKADHWRNA
ncbi:hypothetical protein B296_00035730 [Ensete ventricosum]|uniref:Uncharacterized protein n=1 Tax=Ensete ventricosum TaxID=4639 RepID=A0A426XU54_ENSVE|nr:hypothetical protein B296_00035730 [Ensete ventricosum]